MKNVLRAAILAACAFLPAQMPASAAPAPVPAPAVDNDYGPAAGTVVVWDHYHSGKPTAHLRGDLRDGYGRLIGNIVARLEDNGYVTGYARTPYGYHDLYGYWDFDEYYKKGEFTIKFDLDYHHKIVVEGEWYGERARWYTYWEVKYRNHD